MPFRSCCGHAAAPFLFRPERECLFPERQLRLPRHPHFRFPRLVGGEHDLRGFAHFFPLPGGAVIGKADGSFHRPVDGLRRICPEMQHRRKPDTHALRRCCTEVPQRDAGLCRAVGRHGARKPGACFQPHLRFRCADALCRRCDRCSGFPGQAVLLQQDLPLPGVPPIVFPGKPFCRGGHIQLDQIQDFVQPQAVVAVQCHGVLIGLQFPHPEEQQLSAFVFQRQDLPCPQVPDRFTRRAYFILYCLVVSGKQPVLPGCIFGCTKQHHPLLDHRKAAGSHIQHPIGRKILRLCLLDLFRRADKRAGAVTRAERRVVFPPQQKDPEQCILRACSRQAQIRRGILCSGNRPAPAGQQFFAVLGVNGRDQFRFFHRAVGDRRHHAVQLCADDPAPGRKCRPCPARQNRRQQHSRKHPRQEPFGHGRVPFLPAAIHGAFAAKVSFDCITPLRNKAALL